MVIVHLTGFSLNIFVSAIFVADGIDKAAECGLTALPAAAPFVDNAISRHSWVVDCTGQHNVTLVGCLVH